MSDERIGLHTLKPAPGSRKARKRLGRGEGSGTGKTAGRGQKGYGSRSGLLCSGTQAASHKPTNVSSARLNRLPRQ